MSVPDGKIIQALQRYVFLFVLDFSLASHAPDLMRSFIDEWHLSKYFTIQPRDIWRYYLLVIFR